MRLAFLFPGQGAQVAGMGKELYEQYEEMRRSFAEASEAVGRDVWAMCLDAEGAMLSRTSFVQPAMVALESALSDLLTVRFGIKPEASAGLSLGEYAALHCAGVLTLQEAVRLVDFRGRLMEECAARAPGAMAAVLGLARAETEEACQKARDAGESVWPCNYNCPGQIVISGSTAGVAEATKLLTAAGARRVLPLNVAGAFHTPMMQASADAFKPALGKAAFAEPKLTVYSNATGKPHGADIREAMHRQITSPVLFEDTLRAMAASGIDTFVEIGPGKTLTGFVKKTLEGATSLNVEDAASLGKALEQLQRA